MQQIKFYKKGKDLKFSNEYSEIPKIKKGEILVRVLYASITSGDIARIKFTGSTNKGKLFGSEFSGIVVEIDKTVKHLEEGDELMGYLPKGAQSEYIVLREKDVWTKVPKDLSLELAALLPNGALSALYFLRKAKFDRANKILVYGASSSVGSFAVQIAKFYQLKVTAVCGERNLKRIEVLGADEVMDYKSNSYRELKENYDLVFDCVQSGRHRSLLNLTSENGHYISTQLNAEIIKMWVKNCLKSKKVIFGIAQYKKEDLESLSEIVKVGKLKPLFDRSYSMNEIEGAYAYVKSGRKTGNVSIRMEA